MGGGRGARVGKLGTPRNTTAFYFGTLPTRLSAPTMTCYLLFLCVFVFPQHYYRRRFVSVWCRNVLIFTQFIIDFTALIVYLLSKFLYEENILACS